MVNPIQKDTTSLIRQFGDSVYHCGPRTKAEIRLLCDNYDLNLPPDYRLFLGNYGSLIVGSVAIMGIVDDNFTELSLDENLLAFRLSMAELDLNLVPIERLSETKYVCINCDTSSQSFGSVVQVEPQYSYKNHQYVADDFWHYLHARLATEKKSFDEANSEVKTSDPNFNHQWSVFEKHVNEYNKKYNYEHGSGGKLPRNHEWRPFRFAVQDVIFGLTVIRHQRMGNFLEVDVFLTAEIPEYDPLAGALALSMLILSEAYKCGGTMEVRFTANVESGCVPEALQALASRHGLSFSDAGKGCVHPNEAKLFYAALTGFSTKLRTDIEQLERAGRAKLARACFVVNNGVWNKDQIEMIVRGSMAPDRILRGASNPHERHLYVHDLLHARSALLGGMLDRILLQRQRVDGDIDFDLEDDIRPLSIEFDAAFYAKKYLCPEPIPLLWLHGTEGESEIGANTTFNVLIRAREAADLIYHYRKDIAAAQQFQTDTGSPTFILVPNDFESIPLKIQGDILSYMQQANIGLLVCPETTALFDTDAAQRLSRSRILRQ